MGGRDGGSTSKGGAAAHWVAFRQTDHQTDKRMGWGGRRTTTGSKSAFSRTKKGRKRPAGTKAGPSAVWSVDKTRSSESEQGHCEAKISPPQYLTPTWKGDWTFVFQKRRLTCDTKALRETHKHTWPEPRLNNAVSFPLLAAFTFAESGDLLGGWLSWPFRINSGPSETDQSANAHQTLWFLQCCRN